MITSRRARPGQRERDDRTDRDDRRADPDRRHEPVDERLSATRRSRSPRTRSRGPPPRTRHRSRGSCSWHRTPGPPRSDRPRRGRRSRSGRRTGPCRCRRGRTRARAPGTSTVGVITAAIQARPPASGDHPRDEDRPTADAPGEHAGESGRRWRASPSTAGSADRTGTGSGPGRPGRTGRGGRRRRRRRSTSGTRRRWRRVKPRLRKKRSGSIGEAVRDSQTRNSDHQRRRRSARAPAICGSVQPSSLPWMTPHTSASRPVLTRPRPTRSSAPSGPYDSSRRKTDEDDRPRCRSGR